jgi:hypothetical protein
LELSTKRHLRIYEPPIGTPGMTAGKVSSISHCARWREDVFVLGENSLLAVIKTDYDGFLVAIKD